MGERMGRIRTDFFDFFTDSKHTHPRKIRSDPPDPPHPFSHRISTFQSGNDCPYVFSKKMKSILKNQLFLQKNHYHHG
jgi:hypothetical protein